MAEEFIGPFLHRLVLNQFRMDSNSVFIQFLVFHIKRFISSRLIVLQNKILQAIVAFKHKQPILIRMHTPHLRMVIHET